MKKSCLILTVLITIMFVSCKENPTSKETENEFKYVIDQFADVRVMRYKVSNWDSLSLKQKELVYYLNQAALCGRDIFFDQNYKHNLSIRKTLETIYTSYKGDKSVDDFTSFVIYLKRVWFSNGIHHHYSSDKFYPEFSEDYFSKLLNNSDISLLPLQNNETLESFTTRISTIIFDKNIAPKKVNLNTEKDLVAESAVNFYEGVNQKEVEDFYEKMKKPNDKEPISYGLNSKLVKEDGIIKEKVYKIGGMYSDALKQIVYWLEKAANVAENEKQRQHIITLIEYYKTGDLRIWDEYNILWATDLDSHIDYVNGFVEVYDDPMGMKATWEGVVNFKDIEATKRTKLISDNAQWFEDNSPIDRRFKKPVVKGVSAKVITVTQLGGACYPTAPIGINLPNANWIRRDHGSKSVTMENIIYSYGKSSINSGVLDEFCYSPEEIERSKKHGSLAGNLHTDMHECLGHGSGQLLPGISDDALKNFHSPLEEARADLFALYYLLDPKMIELGLFKDFETAKAAYDQYIRNGLMVQLTRIQIGKDIEQAHMRSRALVASWCYERGLDDNVILKHKKDGKTFFTINNYEKLRELFGELLGIVQEIKSTGNYEAGKDLVEKYGIKIDPVLHNEVLERYAKLNIAPYGGFINPVFVPVKENEQIIDFIIEYPESYINQMLDYSKNFSFLPYYN